MSEPIKRLTDNGRNALLQLADAKPELWQVPGTDFDAELRSQGVSDYAEEIDVISHGLIELPSGSHYYRSQRSKMDRNAPEFCDILRDLNPTHITDGTSLGMAYPLSPPSVHLRTVATSQQRQRQRAHPATLVRPR